MKPAVRLLCHLASVKACSFGSSSFSWGLFASTCVGPALWAPRRPAATRILALVPQRPRRATICTFMPQARHSWCHLRIPTWKLYTATTLYTKRAMHLDKPRHAHRIPAPCTLTSAVCATVCAVGTDARQLAYLRTARLASIHCCERRARLPESLDTHAAISTHSAHYLQCLILTQHTGSTPAVIARNCPHQHNHQINQVITRFLD